MKKIPRNIKFWNREQNLFEDIAHVINKRYKELIFVDSKRYITCCE